MGSLHRQAGTSNQNGTAFLKSACTLCGSSGLHELRFDNQLKRDFLHCTSCSLTFVPPSQRLGIEEERERYRLHSNDPDDPAYRNFLSRLAAPLVQKLKPGSRGLDYGCGPGPALAMMLREQGFEMKTYDPFFPCDPDSLSGLYDFITCTETAEHFHSPEKDFERMLSLLRPSGWLAVMTQTCPELSEFEDWHYHRDPTHVSFYRMKTMNWIADRWNLELLAPVHSVFLMRKRDAS